jgi:nicotinate-nucleotide--dimethylbenzimidazole phosphoribosyltransferase
MLSPTVRRTLSLARPLFNKNLANEIQGNWNRLVKPPGSLGRLEDLVLHYGLIKGQPQPTLQRKALYIFCADHGVVAERVSLWPQEVTAQMVRTFLRGGACVNALCRQHAVEPVVIDMGIAGALEPGVVNFRIGPGTANFTKSAAMTGEQLNRALETGIMLAEEAASRFDLVALGEMGVGNSTSAAAIVSALTGKDALETTGLGAGADEMGYTRKLTAVRGGLVRNHEHVVSPFGVLMAVGGFEIAAMTGFLLGAATVRLPVVVDGYIASAAALAARAMSPDCMDTAIFSHQSSEKGHALVLHMLGVEPYLGLDLRLGEGSGAVLAVGLLESALRIYREASTLEEALV